MVVEVVVALLDSFSVVAGAEVKTCVVEEPTFLSGSPISAVVSVAVPDVSGGASSSVGMSEEAGFMLPLGSIGVVPPWGVPVVVALQLINKRTSTETKRYLCISVNGSCFAPKIRDLRERWRRERASAEAEAQSI